jgi:transcriptional regulator with XRE-family HTH domain
VGAQRLLEDLLTSSGAPLGHGPWGVAGLGISRFGCHTRTVANQLGEFLRARRARVRPADVGLPSGTRPRRTPGLRREELAALAGLSIDYYIRLEQGKGTNPSVAILDGLARALGLNEEEHAHLYALADHAAGRTAPRRTRPGRRVRPGIRLLLDTLRPYPAYLVSRTSDVLAANPEALALFSGMEEWPPERRNTIRYTLLHPAARDLIADWPKVVAGIAANLRSLVAADPADPELTRLIDELTAGSREFADLWKRHDVRHRRSERKSFHHPVVGDVTFTYEVLHLDDGQRVMVYQTTPGTTDHDAMTLLSLSTSSA